MTYANYLELKEMTENKQLTDTYLICKGWYNKRLLSDSEWNEFYQGDDGTSTYYIDMVERKFARSSTAPFDKRYDLLDSVDDMFKKIVSEVGE